MKYRNLRYFIRLYTVKETNSETEIHQLENADLHYRLRICPANLRFMCVSNFCTCVEFKLRMKRESTYFETHEYSLATLQHVSTIKYVFLPLANQIVLLQRSDA